MNNRGQSELYYSFFRILLIILLVFLLNIQLNFFTDMDIPSERTEAEIAQQRLLARLVPDGRTVGVIDMAKFDDKKITDTYLEGHGDKNLWGGRLRLYENDVALETETVFDEKFLHPNGDAVKLLPMSRAGVRGRGGANYYSWLHPVIIHSVDSETQGWLTIELVKRT